MGLILADSDRLAILSWNQYQNKILMSDHSIKDLINSVMIVLLFSYFNGFEIQGYLTIDRIVWIFPPEIFYLKASISYK